MDSHSLLTGCATGLHAQSHQLCMRQANSLVKSKSEFSCAMLLTTPPDQLHLNCSGSIIAYKLCCACSADLDRLPDVSNTQTIPLTMASP